MSSNDEKRESSSNQLNSSFDLDEFGVIRDEQSKSSTLFDDPTVNMTDEDFSARILTVGMPGSQRVTDFTGDSEEVSHRSDVDVKAHDSLLNPNSNPHNDESESLTEFEEIERLIKAHTVAESDEDLPELPDDLEQRILSGRVSRASISMNASAADDSASNRDEVVTEDLHALDQIHHDTGYASAGRNSSTFIEADSPQNSDASGQTNVSLDEVETDDLMQTTVLETSNKEMDAEVEEGDQFAIPTNRVDTQQPESLVATFGTTQEFEKLLLQQLQEGDDVVAVDRDMGDDAVEGLTSRKKSTDARIKSSEQTERHRNQRRGKSLHVRKKGEGRYPAAGRVKRSVKARVAYRDSSDDLSIRSDVSRSELRSKLKEEARSRKQDEEFMNELKTNYDALLMKYAEAENTIDHLRLGAKINLYASIPQSGDDFIHNPHPSDAASNPVRPQAYLATSQVTHGEGSTRSHLSSADSDPMVQSSLQLPAAATKEFFKVALQLQAKDVKDKIGSFGALLRETELSPEEREQAMASIVEALQALESDYLHAIDQHAREQRRASIASGGAIDASQEFDPDRSMEAEIVELGEIVKSFHQQLENTKYRSDDGLPDRKGENSPLDVGTFPDVDEEMRDAGTSPDVEQQFKQLLHRYQPTFPVMDDDTSASSLLSETAHEDSGPNLLSDRYLKPGSGQKVNPSPKIRSAYHRDSPPKSRFGENNVATPSARPRNSKLPRPVTRTKHDPAAPDAKISSVNAGTDSGFVGSESSRQSAAAKLHPAKIKLLTAPPAVPVVVKPDSHLIYGKQAPSVSSTQSNPSFHSPPKFRSSDYPGMEEAFVPHSYSVSEDSVDDVSTTSTVREMLHPSSTNHNPSSIASSRFQGNSLKSCESAPRSLASTSRDSTLNLIRGEISKLRDEIKASKQLSDVATYTRQLSDVATSTRPSTVRRNSIDLPHDSLQAIRDDIKVNKESVSESSESDSEGWSSSDAGYNDEEVSYRGSRSRRRVQRINRSKGLKDEIKKQRFDKKTPESETCSAISAPSTGRHARGERSRRSRSLDQGERSHRSRSLDRGERFRGDSRDQRERRSRTKSTERGGRWSKGFWTFVPHHSPAVVPGFRGNIPAAPVFSTAIHPPVIYHSSPMVYMGLHGNPGRIYVKPRELRGYSTPSKPQASVYMSPQQVKKANVYVISPDDEDQPLTRSALNSQSRDAVIVSLAGSRLDESLNRAERNSESLRDHSRSLYKSVRSSVYGASALANTL